MNGEQAHRIMLKGGLPLAGQDDFSFPNVPSLIDIIDSAFYPWYAVSHLPCIHWNYLIFAPLFSRYSIYHIHTFSGSQEYRMFALLNESTFYHVLGFVPASSALTPVQGEMRKTSASPLG